MKVDEAVSGQRWVVVWPCSTEFGRACSRVLEIEGCEKQRGVDWFDTSNNRSNRRVCDTDPRCWRCSSLPC